MFWCLIYQDRLGTAIRQLLTVAEILRFSWYDSVAAGLTSIRGHERYAVEYGPILLCLVGGAWNYSIDSMPIRGVAQPLEPDTWLTQPLKPSLPASGNASSANGVESAAVGEGAAAKRRQSQMDALRFGVVGNPGLSFVPYFLVQEELFEVYPAFPV